MAEVGAVLGGGYSAYPTLAIYGGQPWRIWTLDRNRAFGGEIELGIALASSVKRLARQLREVARPALSRGRAVDMQLTAVESGG